MSTAVHVREWGSGDRNAVLIHGLGNSSTSWSEVGPELARRGYHVHAVDLPGHGDSARIDDYTVETLVDAVVAAVPASPELAIGHSLGGLTLAHAVKALQPDHAVYVDPAWRTTAAADIVEFFRSQKNWTLDDVAKNFPNWDNAHHERKLDALAKWDPAILDGLGTFTPADVTVPVVPSTVVLADPSTVIPPARAAELSEAGFDVKVVPGAGHVVHIDDHTGFFDALKDVIS